MKQPAVYILASQRNGTLYIGVTSDLIRRVWQHKEGLAEGFTKEHGVKMLVWYEQHATMESAIGKEKAMKKWLRAWKLKTIEQTNPEWNDLWPEITGATTTVIPVPPVIPCHPRAGGGNAGIQQNKNAETQPPFVVPAYAGTQQNKNAFSSNPLDSRLRGNDEVGV